MRRIAKEAVEDAAAEGIRLLELRYAPSFIAMGHEHPFDDVLRAVQAESHRPQTPLEPYLTRTVASQDGIEEAKEQHAVEVGLICIAVAAMGSEEVDRTVHHAVQHGRNGYVGFDVAGAPTNLAQWAPAFRRIAEETDLGLTCHAAEDAGSSPWDAVTAIEELGCSRVGHGIQARPRQPKLEALNLTLISVHMQIVHDAEAMQRVVEHGVVLEVSATSNWLTSSVPSMQAHPARMLFEAGVRVCVNTDDPGIMHIDLPGEYQIWRDVLGFSVEELKQTNAWALEASFVTEETKQLVREHFV